MQKSTVSEVVHDPYRLQELIFLLRGRSHLYLKRAGKKGGHFCLADEDGRVVFLLRLDLEGDEMSSERAERTFRFCQEKIARLHSHPEHVASWQSRNEAEEKYGGAIRIRGGYASFSGLPELADEAFCMSVTNSLRLLGLKEARAIQKLTGNEVIEDWELWEPKEEEKDQNLCGK